MDEPKPNIVMEMLGELFKLVGEMLGALWSVLPKIISFLLWVLAAVFILPCVFVAGNIYPAWVKWGEEF